MTRLPLAILFLVATSALSQPIGSDQTARKRHLSGHPAAQRGVPYAGNSEAMRWADDLAARRGLDPAWVRRAV